MSNKIRCKFRVNTITEVKSESNYKSSKIDMSPVYSNDETSENKKYWDATPAGSLSFSVTNDSLSHVKPGQEYYVDLTLAE